MATCLSVLRFASTKGTKEPLDLLIKRIDNHFVSTGNEEAGVTTITISNRYFSANVALALVSDDDNANIMGTDIAVKEDGIILVVDASQMMDLSSLSPIHDRAVLAGSGDVLRLCVALNETDSSGMTPKQIEEDYSRRILWCLDRGYEYIASCDLSEKGVLGGHDERDKEGFARIVEAIQGTVWSSAVMEKKKKKQLETSFAETQHQLSSSAWADYSSNDQAENAYEPPDPSQLPPLTTGIGIMTQEDKDREERARESLLNVDEENNEDACGAENFQEEVSNEHLMDAFEGALRQANRIRDMSRSGQMSDEDRRQRAGDAAVLLIDLLGKMGYDDDDEDDREAHDLDDVKADAKCD